MKTLSAFFSKKSSSKSIETFQHFSLNNQDLNYVRGGGGDEGIPPWKGEEGVG